MKIDFPIQLDKDSLDPFFERLRAVETHPDKVTINFSTLGFSTPTSMLVLGVVLQIGLVIVSLLGWKLGDLD